MKVTVDFRSVNLATGEKSREIVGDGEKRIEVIGPTMSDLDSLQRILHKAEHRTVADAFLKAFMWACWPEWYERNKWEFYKSKGQSA